MQLRPYQALALADIQNAYRSGKRRPLLCAPTGSGKSAMTRYMLERTRKRTLILAHRQELVDMISEALPVPHGIIAPGRRLGPDQIQVGMMQTVSRRLDDLPAFEWVISDECHLSMSPTWRRILDHYKGAHHLGMSATPCRLDGKGLGEVFDAIVYGPSVAELVARGYLVPARVFAPAARIEAASRGGDFAMDQAGAALDQAKITGDAVAQLRKHGPQRQAIAFCCTREHAQHVAEQFTADGFPAANIDGAMTAAERGRILADFRARRLAVLTNVDLLTTGFDCPQIDALIFLRPTQSLALYLQMLGRALRPHPGKENALILDHVGNTLRHGLADAPREWSLDGKPKRSTPPPVRQCSACFAAFSPAPKCPACGQPCSAVAAPRRDLSVTAGDLVEIDAATIERVQAADLKSLLRTASTMADLQLIAKIRGYKPLWAFQIMRMRRQRRPA